MAQQTIPLSSDARERFLLTIADTIPAERIAEIHFFPPIRTGPLETGVAVVAAEHETAGRARHVVYTARYRWTRKGPDRGKWEAEVVAEADAPLITVEATPLRPMSMRPPTWALPPLKLMSPAWIPLVPMCPPLVKASACPNPILVAL